MHLWQHKLCTRKMELALEGKFCLDFHWVSRPWWRTLTNGSDVKYVFPRCHVASCSCTSEARGLHLNRHTIIQYSRTKARRLISVSYSPTDVCEIVLLYCIAAVPKCWTLFDDHVMPNCIWSHTSQLFRSRLIPILFFFFLRLFPASTWSYSGQKMPCRNLLLWVVSAVVFLTNTQVGLGVGGWCFRSNDWCGWVHRCGENTLL